MSGFSTYGAQHRKKSTQNNNTSESEDDAPNIPPLSAPTNDSSDDQINIEDTTNAVPPTHPTLPTLRQLLKENAGYAFVRPSK